MLLEALKIFRDIVETGSYSRAAERNFVTQSAVSQQIKHLEHTLSIRLLERRRQKIGLTPAGQIFYRGSREIISRYDEMLNALQKASHVMEGHIRISTIHNVGTYVLQSYVKNFIKRYPHVRIHIEYRKSSQVYEDLLSHRADLGIVAFPTQRNSLQILPFRNDEMVLIAPPTHPFSRKRRIDIRAIAGQKFIAFSHNIPTRRAVDDMFKRHGVRVEVALESDDTETLKSAVEIGEGLSVVPQTVVEREVRAGKLCAVRFSNETFHRPEAVLIRRKPAPGKGLQEFVTMLTSKQPSRKSPSEGRPSR